MALTDLVHIQIDDSMIVDVGMTVTDQLGYDSASGLNRREWLTRFVRDFLILTYQRGKRRENDEAFMPPADPELEER